MSSGGSEFEQTTVFRRFLNQKGGLANVLMAGFCCALSLRLLQMRTEYEQRASALESAFSAERETLRAEIDRLKGKGRWFFGSSRGGGRQSESPRKPDGAKNPPRGLEARANAGKETKGVFI